MKIELNRRYFINGLSVREFSSKFIDELGQIFDIFELNLQGIPDDYSVESGHYLITVKIEKEGDLNEKV